MEKVPEDELPVKQKRTRKMTPELLAKLADARKKAAEIKKEMAGNVPAKVQHAKEKIKKERQHSKKHIKKLAEDELDKEIIEESNLVDLSTDAKILEKEDEATPKKPEPEEPQTEVAEAEDPVPEEKIAKPKKSKKPVIIEESSDEEEVVYVKKRILKKKDKKIVEPDTPPPSPERTEPEEQPMPKWIKGVPPSLMKIRTCGYEQRKALFRMI